jgi:hypothetical protein
MRELDKIINGDSFKPTKSFLKYGHLVLVALVAVLLLALIATPAFANPGMTVSNALVLANVSPGQTLTQVMTVSIGSNDPATTISIRVAGVQQSQEGGYILLNASDDTGPYSAREFVSVDKNSFHLEPGGSQDLTATIQVPQDVGAGGRYAIINISTQPVAGAGGIGIITAANVPVYLTIQDSQLVHTGKITELSIGNVTSGQPVEITTTFQNTGNHHYKVKGEVSIVNAQGQSLGNISIPVTNSSILPEMPRQLKASFVPSGELAAGTYTVYSKVMLEDGTMLDQANTTFEVKQAYVPPPAVGNITLTPASAATLTSEDGSISIHFPQGAAAMPVTISLWNYPTEQLPSPPPDISLGTTCFRVDGLTGLLAKEATVTVKYSADDLGKAGGDASRLRLARWDEGSSQWSVLKTKVDEGAMTLSANSNQMSIWAVMVGAPAAEGASWVMPAAIAGGVIVLAALLVLILARGRRRRGKPVK